MIRGLIRKTVDWTVSIPATPAQLAALFAATVIIRNLLEAASLGNIFTAPAFIFHFPVAYIFPLTGLAGLLHLLSGYPLGRLLKIMVFAWTLTLLPPVLDFFMGSSSSIGYFPLERSNATYFMLNFFNPAVRLSGTTAGIRIEAAIGCLLAGLFTAAVARNRYVFRGVLTTLIFAPVFLVFFTWPYLIYVLVSKFFPYAGETQMFMNWHASTEAPLTGGAHYTIFLVDMIPVVLIAGWFLRVLRPSVWIEALHSLRNRIPGLLIPVAGAAAATVISVSTGGLTFADFISILGALTAAVLVYLSCSFPGKYRIGVLIIALFIAAAVGWVPFVLVGLAAAVSALPGPRCLSKSLLFPLLLLVPASTTAISAITPPLAVMLISAAAAGIFMRHRPVLSWSLTAVALIAAFIRPYGTGGAFLAEQTRTTDIFTRSRRVVFGFVSASSEAAAGGDLLHLAETSHLIGLNDRALWAYRVATARGDSSSEMLKVGINLSFSQGNSDEFRFLLSRYMTGSDNPDMEALLNILLAQAAINSDTLMLEYLHEKTGASSRLFKAYSQIYLSLGDTTRAISFSEAAVQAPGASAAQYTWAINLRALTGGDYDGLYREAEIIYPGSTELMAARLRAAIAADGIPDRRDLLFRCLALRPASSMVLETACIWYLSAGMPDSALAFSERALAAEVQPKLRTFRLACRAALAAREWTILEAHSRFGLSLHPGSPLLSRYLAGSLAARGRIEDVPALLDESEHLEGLYPLLDSLCLLH